MWQAAQSSLCTRTAPARGTWGKLWLLKALVQLHMEGAKLELIIQELSVQAPFTAFSLDFTNSWTRYHCLSCSVESSSLLIRWFRGAFGVSLGVLRTFVAFEMLFKRKWIW